MRFKGQTPTEFVAKKWDANRYISIKDAETWMEYFGEIYDIHTRLKGLVPNNLIPYYEKPRVYSGYSMGEQIKCFFQGQLISEEDFRGKYRSGKYRGRENHGLVVINFPTKKKLREYLEELKKLTAMEQKDKMGKMSSDERIAMYNQSQAIRKILLDCVVHEESKIKKGYELY